MRVPSVLVLLLLASLAGCADPAPAGPADDLDSLDVTSETGGIRGVVVDTRIVPVEGVDVSLSTGEQTSTDADGVFTFTGLSPGTYFVTAERILYRGAQTSVVVEAGVADPPAVTIQIERLAGVQPFVELYDFAGFYDCAFALFIITDSCDFLVRTASDLSPVPGIPRGVGNNVNTDYLTVAPSVQTIVQESFWDNSVTKTFRASVDSTPIDPVFDNSEHRYLQAASDTGHTYGRLDRGEGLFPGEEAPEEVAARGFLPFQQNPQDVDFALSLEFQIFTSLFHNHGAQDGWNIEERDQYPVPS